MTPIISMISPQVHLREAKITTEREVVMALRCIQEEPTIDDVREKLAHTIKHHSHISAHGSEWEMIRCEWDGGPNPIVTYRRYEYE